MLRLTLSAPLKEDGRSFGEQYAWLCEHADPASPFEREFLDYLFEKKLKLPDFAQYTPASDVFVQPDFYYRRGEIPGVCVFVDGPQHDQDAQTEEDRRAREALEDRGYRVVAIRGAGPLAQQIADHPNVFALIVD